MQIGLLFLFLGGFQFSVNAQEPEKLGLDADNWAVELSKVELTELNSLGSLIEQLTAVDSIQMVTFLDTLEKSKKAKGYYFKTYFHMVKAEVLFRKFATYEKFKNRSNPELTPVKEQLLELYAKALDAAYHTESEKVIGWVNFYSARRILTFGETAWAVMYSKNGVDQFAFQTVADQVEMLRFLIRR
ncbi:hypothetical protein, partial [Mongoliibacter sp.]|uniref:hypothetical protein n=1 Tax=Mongoliibacter sp. TaxID=2022438 RepID=UPI0025D78561